MAFAAGVEILTPKPASTIFARNPATHLVLRQSADGGERRLKVKAGNVIIDPSVEMQDEGKDYLHFRLPLVPGVNTFTILPAVNSLRSNTRPLTPPYPEFKQSLSISSG
jgi:hypothetical protein